MGRRGALLLAIAASVLGLGVLGGDPALGAGFCERGIARDYAKELRALPALRPIPDQGRVPFGPATVFLGEATEGSLLAGQQPLGFHLAYDAPGTGGWSQVLDWEVEARVVKIDPQGREQRVLASFEKQVKRLRATAGGGLNLSTRVGQPGFYRSELVISDLRSGKRLGRYGKYVRVLRPSLDASIALNASVFRPGEALTATLVNRGTETLAYGLSYAIEGFDGSSWSPALTRSPRPVPAIGLTTGPGAKSTCWLFQIPADAPAGLYRFAWSGEATSSRLDRSPTPLDLFAEFTIAAGS